MILSALSTRQKQVVLAWSPILTILCISSTCRCFSFENVTEKISYSNRFYNGSNIGSDHSLKLQKPRTLIIAHRGASGYLPEATLPAYELAAAQGADYLEVDVIATRDGHLIACHDPNLNTTTDVALRPEFSGRKRVGFVDFIREEGFFAVDFTLEEIKTLRVRQVIQGRPRQLDYKFPMATLAEIIALAKRKSLELNRTIGVYIETKNPTYHRQNNLTLETILIQELRAADWLAVGAPVILQSFEPSSLKLLRESTNLTLIQLIDASGVNADGSLHFTAPFDAPYDWKISNDLTVQQRKFDYLVSNEGLREVATYANGIGPNKRYIVTTVSTNSDANNVKVTLQPTDVIARAHSFGLLVHAYTFRNEQRYLPNAYEGNAVLEYLDFLSLSTDGFITDFTDTAVSARTVFDYMDGFSSKQ